MQSDIVSYVSTFLTYFVIPLNTYAIFSENIENRELTNPIQVVQETQILGYSNHLVLGILSMINRM